MAKVPPLRTPCDFFSDLPNFNDLERCGQRMFNNLLYYQTNYFFVFLAFYGLTMLSNPMQAIGTLIMQALIIGLIVLFGFTIIFMDILSLGLTRLGVRRDGPIRKWIILIAVIFALRWSFLPYILTAVHALLRGEDPRINEIITKEDLRKTPMGMFLLLSEQSSILVRERRQ